MSVPVAIKKLPVHMCQTVNVGSDYDEAETEFIRAVVRYRQEHHRPVLTLREYIHILRALGWHRG